MSKINVISHIINDHRVLKVSFFSIFKKNYDYYTLSFKCGNTNINIISTSSGSINEEGNVKLTESEAELFVNYCESASELECLVGYYHNNNLLHHETLIAYFDNTQQIKETKIEMPYLKTAPGSFRGKFEDFFSALSRRKSSWKIQISCSDDVLLDVISKSNSSTIVTFGENTKDILASDYIFSLDSNVDKLNFPIEIIKQKYSQYNPKSQLGIFEMVKTDFLENHGVYYKNLISNLIPLSNINKIL